jgi:molybdenum cofactor cytidylyltransferase
MPYVAVETIARIAEELVRGAPIVVPVFGGQRGHPVGFSRAFGAQLMALRGDSGARAILAAHPAQIRQVEVSDAGVVKDIDTPPDVEPLAGS